MTTNSQKRWLTVSSTKLAKAVFTVVKGNCQLLDEEYSRPSSVWRKIAKKLGNRFKDRVDSYWAYVAFIKNDDSVQVSFSQSIAM